MSFLFRDGLLHKDELIWKDATTPYYMSFAFGDWDPSFVHREEVYSTESLDVRFLIPQEEISVGWSESNNNDEVIILTKVTAAQLVKFNRVFVIKGGQQRAKYKVKFSTFNTFELLEGEFPPPIVAYGNRLYELENWDEALRVGSLIPINNAPYLPSSGMGTISDASGILLVAEKTNVPYLLEPNKEITMRLYGFSK